MISELRDLVNDFPGPANQTRCFAHILNLVVKSILHQFDLPKTKSAKSLDDGSKELLSLAGNVEDEDDVLSREGEGEVDTEEPEDDNIEGWVDECTLMDNDDVDELERSVKPVRVLLTKVRQYYLIHYYLINKLN
jgi:hypothetical protein